MARRNRSYPCGLSLPASVAISRDQPNTRLEGWEACRPTSAEDEVRDYLIDRPDDGRGSFIARWVATSSTY